MPSVDVNGITIEYKEIGDRSNPSLLLIMGLGRQLVSWPEEFLKKLVEQNLHVILFDNRDIGLSTKFDNEKTPNILWTILKSRLKLKIKSAYTLEDMAQDSIELLDKLGIEKAHVAAVSMGGMISQIIAAKHPQKLHSWISIMSTSGNPKLPGPKPDLTKKIFKRPKNAGRESLIEHSVKVYRLLSGSIHRQSDDVSRETAIREYDRMYYLPGVARQVVAIAENGSRVKLLKTIKTPTLVIHGKDDPLIPVEGGFDTARHISNAKFEMIDGWGHTLPPSVLDTLVELITNHISKHHPK